MLQIQLHILGIAVTYNIMIDSLSPDLVSYMQLFIATVVGKNECCSWMKMLKSIDSLDSSSPLEVHSWLKSLSPGLKLERLSTWFKVRGLRSIRSLAYVKSEDRLNAFFLSPDKCVSWKVSIESRTGEHMKWNGSAIDRSWTKKIKDEKKRKNVSAIVWNHGTTLKKKKKKREEKSLGHCLDSQLWLASSEKNIKITEKKVQIKWK